MNIPTTHASLSMTPAPGWHVCTLTAEGSDLRVDVAPLVGWATYIEQWNEDGDDFSEMHLRPAALDNGNLYVVLGDVDNPRRDAPFGGLSWRLTDRMTHEPWFSAEAGLEPLAADSRRLLQGVHRVHWYDRGRLVATLVVEFDNRKVVSFHYLGEDGKPDTSNGGGTIL